MTMIEIIVTDNVARCASQERLTSGTVGKELRFAFDGVWTGLSRTAVFTAGPVSRDVLLTGDTCAIPWEVLATPGYDLICGVYGSSGDGTLVIPTVYVNLGRICPGADPSGDPGAEPSPSVVEQVLAASGEAVTVAQSVRDDADAGLFDGPAGPQGPQGPAGQDAELPATTALLKGDGAGGAAAAVAGADYQSPVGDLAAIRSGAALGATAVQPAAVRTTAPTVLADNTVYNLTNVSTLTFAYPAGAFDCIVNLTTAASGTITVTFPASVYQPAAPAFGNGETWTLWIRNNPVGTGGMVTAQKAVSE